MHLSYAGYNSFEKIDAVHIELQGNFQLVPKQQLLVLHSALEGPNAKVGGLGSVVTDLIIHQNHHQDQNIKTMESYALTPYYQFLKDKFKNDITQVGQFSHYMCEKMAITTVYKNNFLNQFFLEPDDSVNRCMDVVQKIDDIYEQSYAYLRLVYWNSATAAFASLFTGLDQKSTTNILHIHGWQSGLSTSLLKKVYNPAREKVGLPAVKVVATTHILNNEQGIDHAKLFQQLGLPDAENEFINLAASMNIDSDISSTVSEGVAYEMLHSQSGYGLHHIFQIKKYHNAFFAVINGIDYVNFNPTLPSVLGDFATSLNHVNISKQKKAVKQILCTHNIIHDSQRSLMLYIGRFSSEKGISFLEQICDEWTNLGGQMVIMGTFTADSEARDAVARIADKENPYVKIYTNLYKDQLSPLSSTINIKKGILLRFAADWVAVPSFIEACGLVPMEALSFGTCIFTSHVQGLKDICLDHKYFNPIKNCVGDHDTFNSVTFKINPWDMNETRCSLSENLKIAFDLQNNHKKEWKQYQIRWSLAAKSFDWHASINKYYELYKKQ